MVQMSKKLSFPLFVLTLALLTQNAEAKSSGSPGVFLIKGKKAKRLKTQINSSWTWSDEDIPKIINQISFDLPKVLHRAKFKSSKKNPISFKNGHFEAKLGGLRNMIRIANKKKFRLLIKTKNIQQILTKNCEQHGIVLEQSSGQAPYPIGISCAQSENIVRVKISVPKKVDLSDSTLFEVAGKGERWKEYQIQKTNLLSEKEFGKFTYSYRNKLTGQHTGQFTLKSVNKAKQATATQYYFEAALGTASIAIESSAVSDSPFLLGGLFSYQLSSFPVILGASFRTSLKLSSSEDSKGTKFQGIQTFLKYNFNIGKNFYFSPNLHFFLNGISDLDNGKELNHQQLGLGTTVGLSMKKIFIELSFAKSGILGESISDHTQISAKVGYVFNLSDRRLRTGLGYESNNYDVTKTSGTTDNFNTSTIFFYIGI